MRALQVIFNIFRQKLIDELFPAVKAKGVGILARVPLASGILTGKFSKETRFADDDHRNYNRDGQVFNVGETFAGLPFEKGVELADQLRWIADGRGSMARAALRWILSFDAVSCAIPGFKNVAQVEENVAALEAPVFRRGAGEAERVLRDPRQRTHPRSVLAPLASTVLIPVDRARPVPLESTVPAAFLLLSIGLRVLLVVSGCVLDEQLLLEADIIGVLP